MGAAISSALEGPSRPRREERCAENLGELFMWSLLLRAAQRNIDPNCSPRASGRLTSNHGQNQRREL